jgi:type IV pilus assembly protein PilA
MAILAGALAPALIKYIAKSRRSTDVSNAQTIATAVTNALSVEDAYDAAVGGTSYTVSNSGTGITPASVFSDEVLDQLGTSTYKPKYDKGQSFIFTLSSDLKTFKIYVNSSELYPDVNSAYK